MDAVGLVERRDRPRRRRGRTDRRRGRARPPAPDRSVEGPARSRARDCAAPACRRAAPRCAAPSAADDRARARRASPSDRCRAARRWRRVRGSPRRCRPAPTSRAARGRPPRCRPRRRRWRSSTAMPLALSARSSFAGKRVLRRKPEAGGERIAEHHDADRTIRRARRPGRLTSPQQARNMRTPMIARRTGWTGPARLPI